VAISPWALPFYLSYIFIVVFTVLNVLIGIVLNAMDEARQESKSRREQLKELNQIVHEVDEIATDGKVTDAELVTLKEKIKEMEAILKSQNKDLAD
jgi:voltage-gated sodium channel